jgi:hypothetical protein
VTPVQPRAIRIERAAQAFIDDLRARRPGEEFRYPYVRELNEALKETS